MLELKNVQVQHGPTVAVRGVSLSIAASELLALVGSNGAGKSSLARAIAGTHRPVQGSIRFLGVDITNLHAPAISALGLTHLAEGRPLAPTLSVRDNLLSGAYVLRSMARAYDRLEEVLPLFPALAERIGSPAATLSGGERQWLVVARALMARPKLLLIDEPTLGLAPRAARETLQVIADLRRFGSAILLIEQNAALGLEFADYGLVMGGGRIIAQGAPRELITDPSLTHSYLGGAATRQESAT